jgi:hypothetical protein
MKTTKIFQGNLLGSPPCKLRSLFLLSLHRGSNSRKEVSLKREYTG